MELYRSKEWLHEKHNVEMLSCREMAKLCSVDKSSITKWMKRTGVEMRSRIESVKLTVKQGKNQRVMPKGENHPCWGKKLTPEHKAKIGINQRGENNKRWKGGRHKLSSGYFLNYNTEHPHRMNNYVLEHRIVVEKKIGRILLRSEDVHHIDEDKENNNPDNLHLFKSRRDHSYYHKMKNIGREVALQYEYEQVHRNRKMV